MNGIWVEVFRTGVHRDMNGNEKLWTIEDLNAIVSKYDPQVHEAPIVIGHPTTNGPAYGWVKALRVNGEILEAMFGDIVPEFVGLVKSGYWKKRSISLYPDMTLRHVGFLGAVPPAVKGLKDVPFAASDEAITIDFTDNKEHQAMDEIQKLKKMVQNLQATNSQFSSEKDALSSQLNALSRQLESERSDRRVKELESFCDELISEGHILPVQTAQIMEMLNVLDKSVGLQFSDGQKSGVEAFVELMKSMPKQVDFSEHATHDQVNTNTQMTQSDSGFESVDPERLEIHNKAMQYASDHNTDYASAVVHVMNGGK